jgi:hypothetical protein
MTDGTIRIAAISMSLAVPRDAVVETSPQERPAVSLGDNDEPGLPSTDHKSANIFIVHKIQVRGNPHAGT